MPFNFFLNPNANLTILLMLAGLIGAVIPVVPGPVLIWLGALAWAAGERYQRVDPITLAVLGVIAIIALFSELWLTPLTQRKAGFGWRNVAAAIAGGIAGGILLSEIPIAGTLCGASIGSVVAVSALTFWERRNLGDAINAGQTYLKGCALSSAVEIVLSLLMIAIFAWRALL